MLRKSKCAFCELKLRLANINETMILQHIFSMAIAPNLFATLLLFCVSAKRELAIPFLPLHFTFMCISLFWALY